MASSGRLPGFPLTSGYRRTWAPDISSALLAGTRWTGSTENTSWCPWYLLIKNTVTNQRKCAAKFCTETAFCSDRYDDNNNIMVAKENSKNFTTNAISAVLYNNILQIARILIYCIILYLSPPDEKVTLRVNLWRVYRRLCVYLDIIIYYRIQYYIIYARYLEKGKVNIMNAAAR